MSYSESNYVRAVNAAAAIVAQSDTSDLGAKDVAANVLELAKYLAVGQDKYFKKAGFEGNLYSKGKAGTTSSGPSATSSGPFPGPSGLTPKQRASLEKAFNSIKQDGKTAPYTIEEIEALSADGGQSSERSTAIGKVFDLAWSK